MYFDMPLLVWLATKVYSGELNIQQISVVDKKADNKNLSLNIKQLELSVRASLCLNIAEIETVGELITKTETELLRVRNMGRTTVTEIKEILEELGLTLKD